VESKNVELEEAEIRMMATESGVGEIFVKEHKISVR
jgi:hypothetical protein